MYYKVKDEKELAKVQERMNDIPGKMVEHIKNARVSKNILYLEMDVNSFYGFDFSSDIDLWKLKNIFIEPTKKNGVHIRVEVVTFLGERIFFDFVNIQKDKVLCFEKEK